MSTVAEWPTDTTTVVRVYATEGLAGPAVSIGALYRRDDGGIGGGHGRVSPAAAREIAATLLRLADEAEAKWPA